MPNRRPQIDIVASGQYRGSAPGPGEQRRAVVAPSASPEEAAAVVAVLEQFMRATAAPPAPPEQGRNPWLRAALFEGTGREPDEPSPWGDPHPWG